MSKNLRLLLTFGILGLPVIAPISTQAASYRLTDAQMDAITAGRLDLKVTTFANSVSSAPAPATTDVKVLVNVDPNVAYGYAVAMSYGNQTSTTNAEVVPSGGFLNFRGGFMVKTSNGLSESVAFGIAVRGNQE